MLGCKNKFWTEDIKCLFTDFNLLPNNKQNLATRFNNITKLIFLIGIVLMLFIGVKNGLIFLLLGLVVVMCSYYSNSQNFEIKENFAFNNNTSTNKTMSPRTQISSLPPQRGSLKQIFENVTNDINFPPRSGQFAEKPYILPMNQTQYSLNQKLTQGKTYLNPAVCQPNTNQDIGRYDMKPKVNPNTLKAPVVVPPIYDLSAWRANDFVNYARINDERIQDKYQSGYFVQKYCPETPSGKRCSNSANEYYPDLDTSPKILGERDCDPRIIENYADTPDAYDDFRISSPIIKPNPTPYPNHFSEGVTLIENDDYLQPGDVLTVAGYNPSNLKYDLPSNAAFGACEKNPRMTDYNQSIYTQTLQPGYLSRSQIIEPISSNIGISFDQQFVPTTLDKEGNDWVYNEHDPRVFKPTKKGTYKKDVSPENVYDPRFTGYGTSYRGYTDKLTGQPRFYYDDVNAIRRPNYLTRNKLDTFNFGEHYGPMKPENMIYDDANCNVREKAQQQFLDDSISFRTGLQESLMRKRNNEMWQLRKFPQSRAGNSRRC